MIKRLRAYYDLPDKITDAEIHEKCEKSLGHTLIKLNDAFCDLKKAVLNKLPWLTK